MEGMPTGPNIAAGRRHHPGRRWTCVACCRRLCDRERDERDAEQLLVKVTAAIMASTAVLDEVEWPPNRELSQPGQTPIVEVPILALAVAGRSQVLSGSGGTSADSSASSRVTVRRRTHRPPR